jgi:hypothetical protein
MFGRAIHTPFSPMRIRSTMQNPMSSAASVLLAVILLYGTACAGGPAAARGSVPALATEGLDPAAASMIRSCGRFTGDEKAHCYQAALIGMVQENGVASAMAALEQLGDRDPDVRHLGHVFAHHIGLSGYRPDGSVDEVFLSCTPLFQSGCYHGVVQAFFADARNLGAGTTSSAEQLDRLCGSHRGPNGDAWLLFQCVHGVGHGLVGIHHGHLPRALAGCDLLPTEWEREGCYGGAFMEVVVSATMPHHGHAVLTGSDHHHDPSLQLESHQNHGLHAPPSEPADHEHHEHHEHHEASADQEWEALAAEPFPPLDRNDPHHPCSSLPDRYLPACYSMQTSAVLFWSDGDTERGAEFCLEAPEEYRHLCFSSLGRDISAYTAQDHPSSIAACGTSPAEFRGWCYRGVAKHFVDLTAEPDDALVFCAAVPEEDARLHCFQAVGEQIALLDPEPDRRASLCSVSGEAERRACILGADLPDPEGTPTHR